MLLPRISKKVAILSIQRPPVADKIGAKAIIALAPDINFKARTKTCNTKDCCSETTFTLDCYPLWSMS